MSRFYAGIGSRETPADVLSLMEKIAARLGAGGFTLRSGGAGGADSAFERGAAGFSMEIFLPWKGFNGNRSPHFSPSPEAFALAEQYHPAWHRLSQGARKLMARNSHQVLGANLDSPVEFIVCWTGPSGGTCQALRMAACPVFNLIEPATRARLEAFVG